jgi:phthiocerol/phenolphthiocerol synthesis type-I polyketide synthase E
MADDEQFVAIVGMAGRFPGAADLDEFWTNLAAGVESSTPLPAQDEFDAGFFGFGEGEALLLEPQQRVFLETCWAALEDAGCDPAGHSGAIGVYAGSSQTEYLSALRANRSRLALVSDWQLRLATGMDFLTSRVAYKLGLRGPAVTVQTACSTSLVATHLACQALLGGDCDLALSGGVTVHLWPDDEPGDDDAGLVSPDGHCRSFDAAAGGTVFANGVGVLVLKRLVDARRDRDHIRAVIRGSAVNNDGTDKIGFSAPGITGQAAVIRDAQFAADIDPSTISYVEAHGTGTPLGDPIEVTALTNAFRQGTRERQYCAIGSVKTNIGHVDAAAGAAGVIKTVLAMEHGLLPASLNFTSPNPKIDFASGPFFVNTAPRYWSRERGPRRAGVSALGFGGTNAHLILEEYTGQPAPAAARPWQLLVVSARTESASATAAIRLGGYLRTHDDTNLADVAWTLQTGRRAHQHRRFVVSADRATAAEALTLAEPVAPGATSVPSVAFAFPGQGGQRVGICRDLYEHEPEFRATIDDCAELAIGPLGADLRAMLAGDDSGLYDMNIGQPAVFAVEYALARLLLRWGIRPDVLVGHSLGAYAAACVAGVFSLPDALRLVVERGRLLQSIPAGAMVAVPLPEAQVTPLLTADLDVAVVNSPAQCVIAGPPASIDHLTSRLAARGVDARLLRIPVPAHSRYVGPIVAEFEKRVGELPMHAPEIPLLSELTGTPLSADEVTSPAYWARHLRHTVRFGDALDTLFATPGRVIVEVGPGHALTGIVRRHPNRAADASAVPTLPHPEADTSDLAALLSAVGHLWSAGADIDWPALHGGTPRYRVPLPTYPFQRRRYTVDPPGQPATAAPEPVDVSEPEPLPGNETSGVAARVAALFGQVLGLRSVGPQDSLFTLGGDSVIAAQVARLLRHTFEVSLPLRVVFRNPTVSGLAGYIDEQLAAPAAVGGEQS